MIEDVCIDEFGENGTWKYDPSKHRYFRTQPDGTFSAIIDGKFLPDPEFLWNKKASLLKVSLDSDVGRKLKPTPAVFALWKHWQEKQNARLNS